MRKHLVATAMCLLTVVLMTAQPARAQTVKPIDSGLGISTLPLYPSGTAEIAGTDPADVPRLTLFLPQKGYELGSAVIIAPVGAYLELASNLEGRQMADWFASLSVAAFVLKYRLGAKSLPNSAAACAARDSSGTVHGNWLRLSA